MADYLGFDSLVCGGFRGRCTVCALKAGFHMKVSGRKKGSTELGSARGRASL